MINVQVDEAAAFDMLSILDNKFLRTDCQYIDALNNLINTIGYQEVISILGSNEYKELAAANRKVFKYVDQLNAGKDMSALIVHQANMERYTAKKAIQAKFFSSELTEVKV